MSRFTSRRSWLWGRYEAEYEAEYPLVQGALSDIIDGFMKAVLPLLYEAGGPGKLRDVKGRNPKDTLLEGQTVPEKDEVFRLSGLVGVDESETSPKLEPFEVIRYSVFEGFEGNDHISYLDEDHRVGALPDWLPLNMLGSAAPITPLSFRFGIEHFRSTRTFAMLGYTPAVAESLLMDFDPERFLVKLSTESTSREGLDPFQRLSYLQAAAQVIQSTCGVSVAEDFKRRLQESSS